MHIYIKYCINYCTVYAIVPSPLEIQEIPSGGAYYSIIQ